MEWVVLQHMSPNPGGGTGRDTDRNRETMTLATATGNLGLRFAAGNTVETECTLVGNALKYPEGGSVFAVGNVTSGRKDEMDSIGFFLVFADSSSRRFRARPLPCLFHARMEFAAPSVHLAGVMGDSRVVLIVQLHHDFGGGGPRYVFSCPGEQGDWMHYRPGPDKKEVVSSPMQSSIQTPASELKHFHGPEGFFQLKRFLDKDIASAENSRISIVQVPRKERIHGIEIHEFKAQLLKRAPYDDGRPDYSIAVIRTMQNHSLRLDEMEEAGLNEEIRKAEDYGAQESREYAALASKFVNRTESPPEQPFIL